MMTHESIQLCESICCKKELNGEGQSFALSLYFSQQDQHKLSRDEVCSVSGSSFAIFFLGDLKLILSLLLQKHIGKTKVFVFEFGDFFQLWLDGCTKIYIAGYQLGAQISIPRFTLIIVKMSKLRRLQAQEFDHQKPAKSKYTKTTMKKKQILIEMVLNKNMTIYRASKKLKISNSTAKSIMLNYEKLGTILQRNTQYQIRKIPSPTEEQKEILYLAGNGQATIKVQDANEAPSQFTDHQRQEIIQKMGARTQWYPFLEGPYPFAYQAYKG